MNDQDVQLSGRYDWGGGAEKSEGRGFVDELTGHLWTALADPVYDLCEPVTLPDEPDAPVSKMPPAGTFHPTSPLGDAGVRFTLHVDVDGPDPLGVVSGTVALSESAAGRADGEPPPHFIATVTADDFEGEARRLSVAGFSFVWPGSEDVVRRLELRLTGNAGSRPRAEIAFHGTGESPAEGEDLPLRGPFTLLRSSPFFRDVELEVDREDGALPVEPYDTHLHPDRPDDLPREDLTLEGAFARAGIRIARSEGESVIPTKEAGRDRRWTNPELHDSMELYWSAFGNRAQWKMWIFLAELGESDGLGGIMFDANIAEPGGVDRQGTAIFTRCPFFHTTEGGYPQANLPAEEAVKRELFFNLMHETGHAFNLAHSFQKHLGRSWQAPDWMTVGSDPQALSWMNYPDQATPSGLGGSNASWFYRRFRFRFDDQELLFLRHAPESYVQMGNSTWFQNHGRVARRSLEPRLELSVRSRKQIVEMGEPVVLELKLKNRSAQTVQAHDSLDPSDGYVEIAVTTPRGERRPFVPLSHARCLTTLREIGPGEALYAAVNLTMGNFGFHFKEPGAYRVEASYTNLDGTTAAAVKKLYVRPPRNYDDTPVIHELWNARVGRALYVGGTRVMDDVNDRLDWIREKLPERHPLGHFVTSTRFRLLAAPMKVVDPLKRRLNILGADPDRVVEHLGPIVEQAAEAADSLGHIGFRDLVDTFTAAAVKVKKKDAARAAQERLLGLFKDRKVVAPVLRELEKRVKRLK